MIYTKSLNKCFFCITPACIEWYEKVDTPGGGWDDKVGTRNGVKGKTSQLELWGYQKAFAEAHSASVRPDLVTTIKLLDCATKRRKYKTSNCKRPNCKTSNHTERRILQNVEIQNVESYIFLHRNTNVENTKRRK